MRLLCGLQLSVEGCVVGLLELSWGLVAEPTVRAPVVVPVDPAGGGPLDVDVDVDDVDDDAVRPGVEDRGVDALGLDQPDDSWVPRGK